MPEFASSIKSINAASLVDAQTHIAADCFKSHLE
jgi:hypothetical protein